VRIIIARMGDVFIGSEAVALGGLTKSDLRRQRALFRNVYTPKLHSASLRDRTTGAWLWSRRRAVVAGLAASALHGAQWVDADVPIELIAPNARRQPGLVVRNETLLDDEITHIAQLPVTTPARTAYDLSRHLPRGKAVARIDALARATPFSATGPSPSWIWVGRSSRWQPNTTATNIAATATSTSKTYAGAR
jgi:hypothetical protein